MATTAKKKPGISATPAVKRGYRDLHEHIEALKKAGLLVVVDRLINKDTEMHPLVRWQFRGGLPESDRRAFLFTNVTDAKGKKYDIPVLVCGIAGSPSIYALGMQCKVDEIPKTWSKALGNPIPPRIVKSGPCQEVVYKGKELLNGHGLDELPVPISTPGWDNAPYTSASHFITKDPETGVQNLGNYRGQLRAPDRLGVNTSVELRTGGYMHWEKWKALGQPMPCAVVIGCPPIVSYSSVQKAPESVDELRLAGGLVGKPLNVVKAKTVDLLVPAEAEIIIEGYISTKYLEPEGPFGESHGHVNLQEYNGYMDVTAITRRKNPILTSWVSQVTPSESSCIRRPGYEAILTQHLVTLGVKGVTKVTTHEPLTSLHKLVIVQFEKGTPTTEVWRGLYALASFRRITGKWVVALDTDIDPNNTDAVVWAISFRSRPHRDLQMLLHKEQGHGPRSMIEDEDSAVLINAMLKETFPPISLPKREYMEGARRIWEELGLPRLQPQMPWYGYDLGEWNEELEYQAQLAVKGDYWKTGKWCAENRRGDLPMNTELRTLKDRPTMTGAAVKPAGGKQRRK
ncbi:MAG: UbiD family decarboxylase [Betaproteobacteria bacterium]|nr:UbiD family decarboxylase [Betaproteobacteria bacterium]